MSSSDEEEKSTKPIKKIFVRGLSQEATVETIREHFRAFGEIEIVEFFYDCNSKKDFIFVTYKDEASIKRCLKKKYLNIQGFWCKLEIARPKEEYLQQRHF
ncbi:heterogeneous nuclear ribonucleoprotein A/B-like [Epinephelus fuscoguttatus]|uniref:heterogeneous nuclear ribonucleoprotein A/B-like n=1 Tax=Epinephelus fuscoguttatus TaxID=293821 RepID=UPI0020D1ECF5|nr:heterogeneous nuclear ribonucleoprotein A/B-like [Epinephelus fuscoguttatus]